MWPIIWAVMWAVMWAVIASSLEVAGKLDSKMRQYYIHFSMCQASFWLLWSKELCEASISMALTAPMVSMSMVN